MSDAPHGLRGWLLKGRDLTVPTNVEIELDASVKSLAAAVVTQQVELPLVTSPAIANRDYCSFDGPVFTPDLAWIVSTSITTVECAIHSEPATSDAAFDVLAVPSNVNVRWPALEITPETVDLFTALAKPQRAGKVYGLRNGPKVPSFDWEFHSTTVATEGRKAEYCRHGMARSLCSLCSPAEPERRRTKDAAPVSTIDVFDLLRPYLEPPIETLLAQPLLFPPGRRPFDYQITGIKFLAEHPSALLGDEMGLGKTIQTIVALQILYRRGSARRTLLICPRSLLGVWEHELAKWAPELFVQRVRGSRGDRAELWRTPASVYVTTYETLREDIDHTRELIHRFDVVVLDEVQKIKNASSGIARAVLKVQAATRWGLSGTPLENRLDDLIAIFDYLEPGLLPPAEVATADLVKQRIKPHFLRRRAADVMQDLPEKVVQEIWLELSERQRIAYQRCESQGRQSLSKPGVTRVHVFALITELKQICNVESDSGESCKADYLEDQLESIVESGQKALVFSHLPHVSLAKLEPRLRSFSSAVFDGTLSDMQRQRLIGSFQDRETPRVLLMSVQSGGVGLTLTAANHVFHFDHWWNPAVARQAEGRAHRIGQNRAVFVYDIYTLGTIEERIYQLLQAKQQLFNAVIDDLSAEFVKAAVTDEELFGLFGMKPPKLEGFEINVPAAVSAAKPVRPAPALQPPSAAPRAGTAQNGRRKVADLSPAEFEQMIARLFTKLGYKTQVTPQSHDHGVDVKGKRLTETGEENVIIQCKHKPDGVVGEAAIRELIGARQMFPEADVAMLVTSGKFSQSAVALADQHRIRLIDQMSLAQLMNSMK